MNKANEWQCYKAYHHVDMGYALFKWNKEGKFWQQCSNWYQKKGNLNRYVIKHYGLHIM